MATEGHDRKRQPGGADVQSSEITEVLDRPMGRELLVQRRAERRNA